MMAGENLAEAKPGITNLASHLALAADAVEALFARAKSRVAARLMPKGKINSALLDAEQHMAHGLSWLATYSAAIRELARFGARLEAEGRFGETEQLTSQIAAGEYLNHIAGGIPMNQGEFARLSGMGLGRGETAGLHAQGG